MADTKKKDTASDVKADAKPETVAAPAKKDEPKQEPEQAAAAVTVKPTGAKQGKDGTVHVTLKPDPGSLKPLAKRQPDKAPVAKPAPKPDDTLKADLASERLENARLKAMIAHPEIKADDFDSLCDATTAEGVTQWADAFAKRLGSQSHNPTGQVALSQTAARQTGVATPASDRESARNLYELAVKNASPHDNK